MGLLGKIAAKLDQAADKTIAKRVDPVVAERGDDELAHKRATKANRKGENR